MHIRVGFEMIYDCPQPTPMMFTVKIHFTRVGDLIAPDQLQTDPAVPIAGYRDGFGNWCTRLVAPAGRTRISANAIVNDDGTPDPVVPNAQQVAVQDLPDDTLLFLLGSVTARPTDSPRPPGSCSDAPAPDGHGCRRSATTSTRA